MRDRIGRERSQKIAGGYKITIFRKHNQVNRTAPFLVRGRELETGIGQNGERKLIKNPSIIGELKAEFSGGENKRNSTKMIVGMVHEYLRSG